MPAPCSCHHSLPFPSPSLCFSHTDFVHPLKGSCSLSAQDLCTYYSLCLNCLSHAFLKSSLRSNSSVLLYKFLQTTLIVLIKILFIMREHLVNGCPPSLTVNSTGAGRDHVCFAHHRIPKNGHRTWLTLNLSLKILLKHSL